MQYLLFCFIVLVNIILLPVAFAQSVKNERSVEKTSSLTSSDSKRPLFYPLLGLCHSRPPRSVPVATDLKNTPCAPNDYFKIDCNTCYCNIEKTGYLCTENLCSFPEQQQPAVNASSVTTVSDQNSTRIEVAVSAGVVAGNQLVVANETQAFNITKSDDDDDGGGNSTTTL